MTQSAPPALHTRLPLIWAALTAAHPMVLGIGFFLAHGQGVTPTWSLERLVPADGVGATGVGLSFLAAVVAVALPRFVSASMPADTRTNAERAVTPLILHMALAEAASLVGLVGAVFLTHPPVPERLLVPVGIGLVAALMGFPSSDRVKAWAGRDKV